MPEHGTASTGLFATVSTDRPHVLTVDDDADVSAFLVKVLGETYRVTAVTDSVDVEARIDECKPDLLLIDYLMPGRNGVEICSSLRARKQYDVLPIVFLSALDTEEHRLRAYDAGADDFIIKPFDVAELRAKVEVWSRLGQRSAMLVEKNRYFQDLASRDGLTELISRRYVLELLDNEVERFKRYGSALAVLLIDIDDFKMINDEFGHVAGDKALTTVARFLEKCLRSNDVIARYGGDEFLILLPESDIHAAEAVCQKIQESPIACELRAGLPQEMTLSIGAACAHGRTESSTHLIDAADMAMLTAKKAGKGRFFLQQHDTTSLEVVGEIRKNRYSLREAFCKIISLFKSELHYDVDAMCNLAGRLAAASDLNYRDRATMRNALMICLSERFHFQMLLALRVPVLEEKQKEDFVAKIRRNTEILGYASVLDEEAELLRHINEWYDGRGVPEGLAGDAIPLAARIVALVCTYAWLRRGGSTEPLETLRAASGTRFDPALIETFFAHHDEAMAEISGQG